MRENERSNRPSGAESLAAGEWSVSEMAILFGCCHNVKCGSPLHPHANVRVNCGSKFGTDIGGEK